MQVYKGRSTDRQKVFWGMSREKASATRTIICSVMARVTIVKSNTYFKSTEDNCT